MDEDLEKARRVVEPAVGEVIEKVRAAGVEIGLFGAALVVVGSDIVSKNDGPNEAVRLLDNLAETLRPNVSGAVLWRASPSRPVLYVVGDGPKK
ncbi:MAG: hypothetical protein IH905_15035 [Proteobacteria bacterium]|nr:hypothetical protein [Pseudomonadota bacterium]